MWLFDKGNFIEKVRKSAKWFTGDSFRVSKTKNHVYETAILRNSEAESLLILNTDEEGWKMILEKSTKF